MFPMSGVGFMGKKKGGGSCPSYVPGRYTAEQVDNLVFVEEYIPVASMAEFRNIPTASSFTMGAGTCWEGSYTCGNDKKYIQVTPITINDNIAGPSLSGIYDGNWQLLTYTPSTTDRILFIMTAASGERTIRNLNVNMTQTGTAQGLSLLGGISQAYTIEDCGVLGSVNSSGENGRVGGLFGVINNAAAIVRRCWSKVAATTGAGTQSGGSLGGLLRAGTVENCWSSGPVVGASQCAGLIGRNLSPGIITNCYTISSVSSGASARGLVQTNTGTINASYWNTDTGPATSAGGTASNTLALQTPIGPTGIFATWDDTVWDFGTSSDYPTLIGPPPATP